MKKIILMALSVLIMMGLSGIVLAQPICVPEPCFFGPGNGLGPVQDFCPEGGPGCVCTSPEPNNPQPVEWYCSDEEPEPIDGEVPEISTVGIIAVIAIVGGGAAWLAKKKN